MTYISNLDHQWEDLVSLYKTIIQISFIERLMWYGEIWQPQINGEVTTGNGPQPPPSHRTGTGHNLSDRGDQFGERRETVWRWFTATRTRTVATFQSTSKVRISWLRFQTSAFKSLQVHNAKSQRKTELTILKWFLFGKGTHHWTTPLLCWVRQLLPHVIRVVGCAQRHTIVFLLVGAKYFQVLVFLERSTKL